MRHVPESEVPKHHSRKHTSVNQELRSICQQLKHCCAKLKEYPSLKDAGGLENEFREMHRQLYHDRIKKLVARQKKLEAMKCAS